MELKSLKSGDLPGLVKENLKLYFVKAGLKSGDAIPTELELSERLNISRTAVREALKGLESLGIIEVRHGVGRFLKRFNFEAILENLAYSIDMEVKDFREILDVRVALESAFLDRRVGRYTTDEIKELKDILDSMLSLVDGGSDEAALIREHTRFHLALYRSSGNSLLLNLIKIFATVQRSLTVVNRYRTQDTREFIELHRSLVAAIESGDRDTARKRLIEHFDEPLRWSEKNLGNADSKPEPV
jgi:DNA-binding FadR family transcriptional regulator